MNELKLYKDIVMDSNKNPETYLDYIKSRVHINIEDHNLKEFDKFPLTKAVGIGSSYNTYFVHIKPKTEKQDKKTIFSLGKSITYDTGGLNIKTIHMAWSAIITSVLNTLVSFQNDLHNIHLLIQIAENIVSNSSTRSGQVVKTYNSKMVE